MECLHGVPAASIITKNGKFWRCDDKYYKSCEFFCPDQDRSLFETSLSLWKTNGAPRPMCHVHQEPAKMRVVKNVAKQNFGSPFFVCCNRENPCSFWSGAIKWKSRDQHANTDWFVAFGKSRKRERTWAVCFTVVLIKEKRRVGFLNGNRSKTPTTTAREAPTRITRALRDFVADLAPHRSSNTGSPTQVSRFKAGGKIPTRPSLNI